MISFHVGNTGLFSRVVKMSEKVLLVDDEQDLLETMAERMRLLGIDVSTTTSPWDAIKKVGMEPYDVIVIDFMMPGMDGLNALKLLKKQNPELQVILLTGHTTLKLCTEALELGALDIMEKPPDLKVLIEKIKEARVHNKKLP